MSLLHVQLESLVLMARSTDGPPYPTTMVLDKMRGMVEEPEWEGHILFHCCIHRRWGPSDSRRSWSHFKCGIKRGRNKNNSGYLRMKSIRLCRRLVVGATIINVVGQVWSLIYIMKGNSILEMKKMPIEKLITHWRSLPFECMHISRNFILVTIRLHIW